MSSEIQVYTSNFYSMKSIPSGYEPISIAIGSPSFYNGKSVDCFKPTWNLVNRFKNGIINEEQYISEYLELLYKRKNEVLAEIERLKSSKSVYLCHEPKTSFCHRHIVSKILNGYGILSREL